MTSNTIRQDFSRLQNHAETNVNIKDIVFNYWDHWVVSLLYFLMKSSTKAKIYILMFAALQSVLPLTRFVCPGCISSGKENQTQPSVASTHLYK